MNIYVYVYVYICNYICAYIIYIYIYEYLYVCVRAIMCLWVYPRGFVATMGRGCG
jgi:hypothetical protein